MKIKSIKVQNYGVFYGTHEFALSDKGLVIVLGNNQDEPKMNSNGSGKSTLFDALDWCLFGVIPRGDHVDSIVNEESGKDCLVEVRIEDDSGTPITVRRYRKVDKTNGVGIDLGNVDKTALDPGETQNTIEQMLGMDRDTFHASVLFGQTDLFRFADATDSERMESLTKILQLGQIDEWAELAKTAAKSLVSTATAIKSTIANIQGVLSGLKAQDLVTRSSDWENNHRASVELLSKQAAQADGYADQLSRDRVDLTELQKQFAELEAAAPVDPPDLALAQAEVQKMVRAEIEATAQSKAFTRQAMQVKDMATKIEKQRGGSCGACGQKISGEHVASEVARLTLDAQGLLKDAQQLQAESSVAATRKITIQSAVDALQRKLGEQHKAHAEQVAAIQSQLAVAAKDHEMCRVARQTADSYHASLTKLVAEENPFEKQRKEQAQSIAHKESEEQKQTELLAKTQDTLNYVEFWVDAFGAKGLKNYILDTKLQAITDAANHWVNILTGGTIWVRIETQTLGRSTKALRNKLNVRVFRYMPDGSIRERNYRSWSGGEKQRVSLGIDLGLSSLIAARAQKRYDILIMDEVFRHLDSAGRESVMELLHHLKREKSSVFVVDHDQQFQAEFERRVTVTKLSGRSTIEEENNDYRTGPELQEEPKAAPKRNNVSRRKPAAKRTPVQTG